MNLKNPKNVFIDSFTKYSNKLQTFLFNVLPIVKTIMNLFF